MEKNCDCCGNTLDNIYTFSSRTLIHNDVSILNTAYCVSRPVFEEKTFRICGTCLIKALKNALQDNEY